MPSSRRSFVNILGLPEKFQVTVLVLVLLLAVRPFLPSGLVEYGELKLPNLPPDFRLWGPIVFVVTLAFFIPVFPRQTKEKAESPMLKEARGFYDLTSGCVIENQRVLDRFLRHPTTEERDFAANQLGTLFNLQQHRGEFRAYSKLFENRAEKEKNKAVKESFEQLHNCALTLCDKFYCREGLDEDPVAARKYALFEILEGDAPVENACYRAEQYLQSLREIVDRIGDANGVLRVQLNES